ncbi:unnamed protein product [Closterium sp. Naga37s-1]|nr:unnamed protein product [Closterium sp. Naga37s-1]
MSSFVPMLNRPQPLHNPSLSAFLSSSEAQGADAARPGQVSDGDQRVRRCLPNAADVSSSLPWSPFPPFFSLSYFSSLPPRALPPSSHPPAPPSASSLPPRYSHKNASAKGESSASHFVGRPAKAFMRPSVVNLPPYHSDQLLSSALLRAHPALPLALPFFLSYRPSSLCRVVNLPPYRSDPSPLLFCTLIQHSHCLSAAQKDLSPLFFPYNLLCSRRVVNLPPYRSDPSPLLLCALIQHSHWLSLSCFPTTPSLSREAASFLLRTLQADPLCIPALVPLVQILVAQGPRGVRVALDILHRSCLPAVARSIHPFRTLELPHVHSPSTLFHSHVLLPFPCRPSPFPSCSPDPRLAAAVGAASGRSNFHMCIPPTPFPSPAHDPRLAATVLRLMPSCAHAMRGVLSLGLAGEKQKWVGGKERKEVGVGGSEGCFVAVVFILFPCHARRAASGSSRHMWPLSPHEHASSASGRARFPGGG